MTWPTGSRAADHLTAEVPETTVAARANRRFLGRVVSVALDQGINQFLDLGCGFPVIGDARETIGAQSPGARIALVDSDPMVVSRATAVTDDLVNLGVIHADLRDVDEVLGHPTTRYLIDRRQPVAILMVAVLHFVPGDLLPILEAYRSMAAPGSLLAISHVALVDDERADFVADVYTQTPAPLHPRTRAEIRALFGDWEPLSDGLLPFEACQGRFLAGAAVRPRRPRFSPIPTKTSRE